MKVNWKISVVSALLSISFLAGCNTNKNDVNNQNEINYHPVRYENDKNLHDDINHNKTRGNKPFKHDESPKQTDQQLEKGGDLEFNKNRGAE
jgi:hypothetical protein